MGPAVGHWLLCRETLYRFWKGAGGTTPPRKQARRMAVQNMQTTLRLKREWGLSVREFALRLKRSQTTLAAYLLRAQEDRAHRRGPSRHQAERVAPTQDQVLFPLFAATADREGWLTARFLAAIAAHELAERANRRIERHCRATNKVTSLTLFVARYATSLRHICRQERPSTASLSRRCR